jgi:hypothetical protein
VFSAKFPSPLSSPKRRDGSGTKRDKDECLALKTQKNFDAERFYTQNVGGSSPSPPTSLRCFAALAWQAISAFYEAAKAAASQPEGRRLA